MKDDRNEITERKSAGEFSELLRLRDGAVFERFEKDADLSEYLREHVNVEKFLEYCKVCSNYGHNWSCSPFDFDPMTIWQAYRSFRIVTYRFRPEEGMSVSDAEKLILRMKDVFMTDVRSMEEENAESLALFAGTCNLCRECARISGSPCRNPKKMRHSIESIGGDVGKTVKDLFDIDILWGTKDSLPEYYVLCGGLLMK